MKSWRYIKSFFSETILEEAPSDYSPGLQVWYVYGRKMLNAANVNYSFGKLDKVFRAAFAELRFDQRKIKSVLLLGLGAGNVPYLLREIDPEMHVRAIEIDPVVLELGRKHFGLTENPQLEIILADAIAYVQNCKDTFDLVIVDLFIDDQVPTEATTDEFLMDLARLLAPGGMLMFNRLSHTESLRQQTAAFGRKMWAALPGTVPVDADSNKVFVYEKK
jgi:spermidine synthase